MALPEEVIHSERVPRIGPYSQAVRVGNLVFTAGQAGIDPATGQSAGPTFDAQARQAFANLRAGAGGCWEWLAPGGKGHMLCHRRRCISKVNELFAEFFPGSPPVRSTPVVAIPKGFLFSIDAIAVVE